jgi:hypothetical protein
MEAESRMTVPHTQPERKRPSARYLELLIITQIKLMMLQTMDSIAHSGKASALVSRTNM